MNEQWRPVLGYEGHYEVSNLGNVRRLAGSARCLQTRNRKLVPRNGYLQVLLSKNNKVQLHWVHRLVAVAFHGEPPADKPQVNHISGIKSDNRSENLEWINYSGNAKHAWRTGLRGHHPVCGEKQGNAKFKNADITEIRRRAAFGESHTAIAATYGVPRQAIWRIVRRKAWAHLP